MAGLDAMLLRRLIQRLIEPWQRTDGPGVTIGVVLARELAVHESAGMAGLELGVPIGPATTFRIASVSKQFTCAAVLLLEAENRLSIDSDVRRYLPDFPDLGHRITLAHLMHNTSGIRDMLEVMRAGGADLGQPCTPEDLLAAVYRQRDLNFAPGSRYLYSNSNFMLLGRIVEKVSGESLRLFLDRRIFRPLGMNSTRHVASTTEMVPGLATGYLAIGDGQWRRAPHGFPLHGEGGLVSCATDLALWHANFGSPRVGGPALANALTTMTPFTSGLQNTYARGLRIKTHRGVRTIGHDGLWPGYKTSFVRIPEHDAAVICISNDSTSDPHSLAFKVVDALVEGKPGVFAALPMPPTERLPGRWLNRDNGATLDVSINAEGQVVACMYGVSFINISTEDRGFATSRGSGDFTMWLRADDRLDVERDAGVHETLYRVAPDAGLPPDLAGRYENIDAATTWTIETTGQGATIEVSGPLLRRVRWEIEPIEADFFRVISPSLLFRGWFDCRVLRDAAGAVTGLHVDGGRVKGLLLERQQDRPSHPGSDSRVAAR